MDNKEKSSRIQMAWRIFFYTLGMICLACGVTMNTKTGLGVSCIISVPYSISEIWSLNFGNMTLLFYTLFVVAQCVILRKVTVRLLLQLPLSLVFTRFMNLFNELMPSFGGELGKGLLMLAAAICVTGIGIILTVRTDFVPNPGDGIVNAISVASGISLGLSKNIFDISSVMLSCTIGLVARGKIIGVGLGTVLTMILLGRVVALFSWMFVKPLLRLCGLDGPGAKE